MSSAVGSIKQGVRTVMRTIARGLNAVSGGRLTPNMVTWLGLFLHGVVAYAIIADAWIAAGILLVIFGLFDTLDGELARLQNRVSDKGGFLDASTDRVKEVVLYTAIAYAFATSDDPRFAALAVAACGMSLTVSYVKSKGETMIATKKQGMDYATLNRLFGGGLFPFEIRMLVLVLGLLSGYLVAAVALVALGATITTFQRMYLIQKEL